MTEKTKLNIEKLNKLEELMHVYTHAMGVIGYDAVTGAPQAGYKERGKTLGTLAEISHNLFINEETDVLLKELLESKDELDPVTLRRVELLRKDFDMESKVPTDEYIAFRSLTNDASSVWVKAKAENNYALYEPYLAKIVETLKKFAAYYEPGRDPYDVWLEQYEKGYTKEVLDAFFGKIRAALVPLVAKIQASETKIDDSFLHGNFPAEKQRKLSDFIMAQMGIDRTRCSIQETEHPFTDNYNKNDVRITTHYHEDNLGDSFYSVVHEGGHALYELNSGDELEGTICAGGVSMGIHESQSRFYENVIGRSEPFIEKIFPKIVELFPEEMAGKTAHDFYLAVNKVEPGYNRLTADEVTYCLHIMVRYELEKKLFEGTVTTKELPAEWAKLYKEYLGVDVPSDAMGVMSDSHWSGGALGYFPSYALGNAFGLQIFDSMKKDLDAEKCIAEGNLSDITAWLTEKIYKHGKMYDPSVLIKMVTGKEADPQFYIDYLTEKYSKIYNL